MEEYSWICRKAHCPTEKFRDRSPVMQFAVEQGIRMIIDEQDGDDPESFARAVNNAVDKESGGIMITGPGDAAIVQAVDAAAEVGIPVVTVAEDLPCAKRLAHVGTDWFRMGSVMAAHVIGLMEGDGVVIPVATRSSANIHAAWSGLRYHLWNRSGIRAIDVNRDDPVIGQHDTIDWPRLLDTSADSVVIVAFDAESILPLIEEGGYKRRFSSLTIIAIDPHTILPAYVRSGIIRKAFMPRIEIAVLRAMSMMRAHNIGSSAGGYRPGSDNILGHVDVGFEIVTAENAENFIEREERGYPQISAEIERLSSYLSRFSGVRSLEQEEEGRTRAILNAMPDLIFQIDKNGKFISYRAHRSEDLLVPPEEFLGKNIREVLPPSLAETTSQHLRNVLAKRGVDSYEYELEIGGEKLHFEARMAATGPDDVIAVIRNITDRKRAEEALRESEERFRVAFKTSPDAMLISRIEDGVIIDANDGFESLSGYSRDEAVGRSAFELGLWHDPKDRDKLTGALAKKGFITNLEAKFRLKGNRIHTALLSAQIIILNGAKYILTVTRDIEGWKKAEEALRESEERFRAVFDTAHDAIYIKDRDLKYIAVNPSMAGLFDIPAEQFVEKRYEDVLGSTNAEHNRQVESRVLGGDVVSEESVRTIAGQERIFHVIIVPLRINGGEIIGLCGIAREITETRRLQKAAEQAGRLETAGTIAGQVAHDFNNLLGPLMAYPDIIRDSLPSGSEAHQLLDDMEHAAEQMADINQQLLTLGRRGHYSREPFSLNEIVRQVVDRMRPLRKNLSVATDLAADLKNVSGGAAQMYRVVLNLVTNAYDAMNDGGRLAIRTENKNLDTGGGSHTYIPEGEYVVLTVSDTGRGISDDALANIFDPFFTTKTTDKKRGSGLGLSIVHSVVEDHEGFIDVDSDPGTGTTFRVYLPVSDEEIEIESNQDILGGHERLLVVDDDLSQLDVIKTTLERIGYTVHCAESGEAALRLLERHEYDLLLLDMVMPPGIDGTETYRRALKVRPDQPAVMMSGFAETKQVKEALKLGARMFIRKPFSQAMLASTIRRELERKIEKPADK